VAQEKLIDSTEVNNESLGKDISKTFVDAYRAIFDMDIKMQELEILARSIVPDDFNICDIPTYMSNTLVLIGEVAEIPMELIAALNNAIGVTVQTTFEDHTLHIPAETVAYTAMGIILKRYQIIQYRVQMLQKYLKLKLAEIRKKLLVKMLNGKDDAGSELSMPIKQFLFTVGTAVNVISSIISVLLTFINTFTILNIDAAGCAFGPTPKNLMMTSKMTIANTRSSTTNPIPEPIDIAISQAEAQIETANGQLKKTKVLAMASEASATVANGGNFDVSSFGSLPKFDGKTIRNAIKLLLQTLFDAEALPRYEKLSPTNIRFLVFLTTGFEPAAQKSFGILGYP
jgi:hypothetical protein